MIDIAHGKPLRAPGQQTSWSPDKCAESSPDNSATQQQDKQQSRDDLMTRVLERIESRLPNRIRHLSVSFKEDSIVLSGECSTYYTKQIAQTVAMGVLEYDRLVNNIDVCPVK